MDVLNPGAPTQVAIDLSTGEGANAFLDPAYQSRPVPWARECFITLIDLVVNWDKVIVPIPVPRNLPIERISTVLASLADEHAIEWRRPSGEVDLHDLTDEGLEAELRAFDDWLGKADNVRNLQDWFDRHSALGISPYFDQEDHRIAVPTEFREAHRAAFEGLERKYQWRPPGSGLSASPYAAFSFLVRTLQYYRVLDGKAWYFPHPARENMFLNRGDQEHLRLPGDPARATLERHQGLWSWGRYFAYLKDSATVGPSDWTAEIVSWVKAVRTESRRRDATWNDLRQLHRTHPDQAAEVVKGVALDLQLPARVAPTAKRVLGTGSDILTPVSKAIPPVSMAFSVGQAVVKLMNGTGMLAHVPILNAHLEWPGLLREASP